MQDDSIKPTPRTKRFKLKHDEPISNFASRFNLRRYNTAGYASADARDAMVRKTNLKVGRCRLTVSKSVLRAPMGSALDTVI